MDQADIPALLSRLASDDDAARKMAVFKLQSSINDPAFADVFIASGGLILLRRLILTAGGNTLAYALQSLSRLLEVDMGWDIFETPSSGGSSGDLVERVVELIVTNPLVNILRGAMSILVALVGHSQSSTVRSVGIGGPGSSTSALRSMSPASHFGFRALKPAVAVYPQFFELVIQQLQSADHALCANALMLVNALIRDAVSDNAAGASGSEDGSKLIKRLQDLGLIKAVYNLMQSSALQDLAHPLLEFQTLTKVLLRRWKEVKIDLERPEHRRALKGLHLASAPDRYSGQQGQHDENASGSSVTLGKKSSRRHNPEKWRRLGFETESPASEFEVAGFLGMMDLTDFVRKNEDGFQKLLLEQSTRPLSQRCPVARASLAVTMTLYEHFEVDRSDLQEDLSKGLRGYYQSLDGVGTGGSASKGGAGANDASTGDADRIFRPLLLQWSRLHTAGLQAFFRLWKATGAGRDDFEKVAELVRILVEQVVGQAGRTKDVLAVEEELQEHDVAALRSLQMGLLELSFEDQWGPHLYQVREELRLEALQFVKEQRIRCLLQGSWFARPGGKRDDQQQEQPHSEKAPAVKELYEPKTWRFAKLSHNRRYLHYADFARQTLEDPSLDALTEKVDLSTISSVVSNVSAPSGEGGDEGKRNGDGASETSASAPSTVRLNNANRGSKTTTKITIFAYEDPEVTARRQAEGAREKKGTGKNKGGKDGEDTDDTEGTAESTDDDPAEVAILTLHPLNHSLASEWLDGLLMLLNQAPITAETNKLVSLVSDYGLKIRLLNVRLEAVYAGPPPGAGVVPSRHGLDDDYYYEI